MTENDKEKIKALRLQSMGYKGIATTLGLSKDSVKGYCKRNGLNGDFNVISLNFNEKLKQNLLCACCKKPIKQKAMGKPRKFCSDECRREWWREHPEERIAKEKAIYTFACSYCGVEFSAYGNNKRKYCSHNCFIKDRFWREENGV